VKLELISGWKIVKFKQTHFADQEDYDMLVSQEFIKVLPRANFLLQLLSRLPIPIP